MGCTTTRSLFPTLLLHTSFNWSQALFPILDSDLASITLVVLLALASLVVAYWGLRRLVRQSGGEFRSTPSLVD